MSCELLLGILNRHHGKLKLNGLARNLKQGSIRGESKLQVVVTRSQLSKDARVVVFDLALNYSDALIRSSVLVEEDLVLKVVVNWSQNSDYGGFCKSEFDLVVLVVPQVIHSVGLPIVEVLLLSFRAVKISWSVETLRKFLNRAVH